MSPFNSSSFFFSSYTLINTFSDSSVTITKHTVTLATSTDDRDRASAAPLVVPGLNYNSMFGRNLDINMPIIPFLTLEVSQESRCQSLMVDKNGDLVS